MGLSRRDIPLNLTGGNRFRGRGGEYVSLSDVTREPYLSTRIAFDAVKWIPR